jgi:hypothetical protein
MKRAHIDPRHRKSIGHSKVCVSKVLLSSRTNRNTVVLNELDAARVPEIFVSLDSPVFSLQRPTEGTFAAVSALRPSRADCHSSELW